MELVINTYGVSIKRENEGFVITTADDTQRIPAVGIDCILISRGAQITSDAIMLAIEREIEIIFNDRKGFPVGRVWSSKYGSISTIRKGQVNFAQSQDALEWIKGVICQKIENQQALMLMMLTKAGILRSEINKEISKLEDLNLRVSELEGIVMSDIASYLRGFEGKCSFVYFSAMNLCIPKHLRFEQRSQHPATDIANALLNYGYGLLYSKIEGMMIKTGIDPYVGVLHRDNYNRPVLVYDVIELYRVWIDYVVFSLLSQDVITEEFYSVDEDGAYWLEKLGRKVIIQSVNDYLDETIRQKGTLRSRNNIIFLYIQDLAQKFKKCML